MTPKVLYILGSYRSGTTLLGNLLGQIDGFFSVGELWAIWREWQSEGHLCGCGTPVRECVVWAKVVADMFSSTDSGDPGLSEARRLLAVQRATVLRRHAWRHTGRLLRAGPLPETMTWYGETMGLLYQSITSATGARVIVDSSKESAQAALVRHVDGIDLYFVHIVRDPRGVLFSRYRREQGDGQRPRPAATSYSALNWAVANVAAEAVAHRHGRDRALLLPYEKLVGDPRRAVAEIAALVGQSSDGFRVDDDNTVRMKPTHTVTGNDNRFRTGDIVLRPDVEWQTALHAVDRSLETTLTLPLLWRYGYPIRPRPSVSAI